MQTDEQTDSDRTTWSPAAPRHIDAAPSLSAELEKSAHVRPLALADVAAISELFQKTFRNPNVPAPQSLTDYLQQLFLEHPRQDPEICSRVYVNADDRIAGFIGVLPLAMESNGRTLRAAVASSLMVDHPEHNPTAGARLLRSMLQGPQDLTISETANPLSQRMWERLGGLTVTAYSMEWMRMLRPAAFGVTMAAERVSVAGCLLPLASPLDWMLARAKHNPFLLTANQKPFREVAVDEADIIAVMPEFLNGYRLRPQWDPLLTRWMLRHAAEKERHGPLRCWLVQGPGDQTIGGYLYYGRPRSIAFVLHIFVRPSTADAVVENLFAHAFAQGFVGLKGRTQPEITDTLLRHRCVLRHAGSMVVHSRQPELIDVIRCGDAMISGLVAESWTRLIGGDFR